MTSDPPVERETATPQVWQISDRADTPARLIADRHYNRQKPGTPQFVPPGRCLVLVIPTAAVWVTSWPFAEYVQHAWAGAWVNSAFRNERRDLYLSSDLIREAVAISRWKWDPPDLGMVTFVDPRKVKHKRDPGRVYKHAGFKKVGRTKGGLITWQMLPEEMPDPLGPLGVTMELWS